MALTAVNVTRQFFRLRSTSNVFNAVDDVSLTLENGKITVITGPSGSGKSTLLNMMAGILVPTAGKILIDDTDIYALDDEALSRFRNAHIGVVPQGPSAIHSLDALDNVLLPYLLYHKKGDDGYEEILKRSDELFEKTGIGELKCVSPSEMSGGEIRRMAVARAMIMNPGVILADEPTADLDEENSRIMLSLLRYCADRGSAVLIVTHDPAVPAFADTVLSLRNGKLE